MLIAVASGKGGVGKTTVAVNIARVFSQAVQLLDCDVEEPNAHLFLRAKKEKQQSVFIPIPIVDKKLCNACGECARFCQFNAIVSLETAPLIFPELCRGCGGCVLLCPKRALSEEKNHIGEVEILQDGNITLTKGLLDVGKPLVPPLIRAVRKNYNSDSIAVIDSPPGTSCSMIAAVSGVDFVLLVTEPTAFGLNDLMLAVDVIRELNIPFGVVINRAGVGDSRVENFCKTQGISVLALIPDDRRIAEVYARGGLVVDDLPEYRGLFVKLKEVILERRN